MKDKHNVRRSYRARYSKAFKLCGELAAILDAYDPDEFPNREMSEARDIAHELNQCVHEMNAYRNVLKG